MLPRVAASSRLACPRAANQDECSNAEGAEENGRWEEGRQGPSLGNGCSRLLERWQLFLLKHITRLNKIR